MQDLTFFLGRFHVLALHLPIGMLVAAVAVDWLARAPRRAALVPAVPWLWGATALSAVLTVVLGYMHFSEGGFTGPSASAHRLYGTLVAAACIGVWLLSARQPLLHRRLNVLTGVVLLALVTITGHYGGNLTHGSEYLVEYAPQPLRALAGLSERRAAVTDLAAADPWRDIVGPMLDARCSSCHNNDKRSGELSVVDHASLMRGGETGRVVSAGNAQVSEIMHRVTLPEDDEAFMPAEGKTPLTSDQIEILRWWIDAGAPVDTTVAALGTTDDIEAKLRVEVGLDASAADSAVAPAEAAADPALVGALFEAGFLVRQVSQSDPRLVVSVHSVGSQLDAGQLDVLRTAAGSVVDLDLRASGLDDAALDGFAAFLALEALQLSRNALSDAGVQRLSTLPRLRVLNVYGNAAITDASIEPLAQIANLKTLYVWGTGISADGVDRLRELRPDLDVQAGLPLLPRNSDNAP